MAHTQTPRQCKARPVCFPCLEGSGACGALTERLIEVSESAQHKKCSSEECSSTRRGRRDQKNPASWPRPWPWVALLIITFLPDPRESYASLPTSSFPFNIFHIHTSRVTLSRLEYKRLPRPIPMDPCGMTRLSRLINRKQSAGSGLDPP